MALSVRLDDEAMRALRELARLEGVSMNEVVQRAVLDRAGRSDLMGRVLAANDLVHTLYPDTLRRLGEGPDPTSGEEERAQRRRAQRADRRAARRPAGGTAVPPTGAADPAGDTASARPVPPDRA